MEITGLTERQVTIANLLWNSQTEEEVQAVIEVFGKEAAVMKEMIIAAAMDEVSEIDQSVKDFLDRF